MQVKGCLGQKCVMIDVVCDNDDKYRRFSKVFLNYLGNFRLLRQTAIQLGAMNKIG